MQEKPTNELDEMLSEMKPGDLSDYFKENRKYMADDKKAFYYYFKDVVESKNIRLADVYSFAGLSESYGSKIVRQEKHAADRDLIIRLCVAGHLTWDEMNRALKLYNMSPLYAKDKRDACLIIAINNRMYDLASIDDLLVSQGHKKLSSIK